MGRKIGTKGERKIKIVVERGTSEIVTAFPVNLCGWDVGRLCAMYEIQDNSTFDPSSQKQIKNNLGVPCQSECVPEHFPPDSPLGRI